jgi:DNA primase
MNTVKDRIKSNLIKQPVLMNRVIEQYYLSEVSRRGNEVRVKCPFHHGRSDDSMAINLSTNTFYCFGCKFYGNVLDFVAKYEDCAIKDAILLLNKLLPDTTAEN